MRKRGFTLFEVLLALAVVVILVSVLATTLNVAFKTKQSAEESVLSVRDTQTVGDIFAADASCAVPPNPLTADPNSYVYENAENAAEQADPSTAGTVSGGIVGMTNNGTAGGGSYLNGPFVGVNNSLSFYTTGNESKTASPCGVRHVQYGLSMQSDGHQALVRTADSNLLSDNQNPVLPEEVLITDVIEVQFQYFDGTGWADSWDTTSPDISNMLPYAVKMILTLEPTHPGGAVRMISRCATVWCALKTVNDYDTSTNVADTTQGVAQ